MTIPNPIIPEAPMANAIDDVKAAQPSRLAMEIAVHMEVHAALSTTTQAKAREIDALLAADRLIISPAPSQHTGWSDEAVEAELDIHVTGVNILGEYNIAMRFKGEQFFEGFSLGRNDAMKRSQRDFLERATQHYPLITGRLVDAAPVCPKCSKTCREDEVSICCDDCGMCWPKTADWDTRIDTPTSCGYCFGSGRRMSGGVCPDCAGTGRAASSIAPARMPHSGAKVSDIVAMIDADTIAPATGFEVKADRDSIRFAQQFADMYRSGAQGAEMDCDAAQALALAIDDILASSISPSVAKESGEP